MFIWNAAAEQSLSCANWQFTLLHNTDLLRRKKEDSRNNLKCTLFQITNSYFLEKEDNVWELKGSLRENMTISKFLSFERYNSDQGVTSGTYKPEKQGWRKWKETHTHTLVTTQYTEFHLSKACNLSFIIRGIIAFIYCSMYNFENHKKTQIAQVMANR